jgi:hypothetical protein
LEADVNLHQLNLVPMWLFTLLFALMLMASMAAGMRLRRFVGTDPASVGSGQLIFGTMSILTLLVGFTFSLALNRHDQRRDLVLEEANAIRALHRMLVHVEEPGRTQISDTLGTYAKGRLAFMESNVIVQEETQADRVREREHLNEVVATVVPRSDTGMNQAQILATATRILDAGTRMEAAMLAHVPGRVVLLLVLLSTGCSVIVGISIADRLPSLWLPAAIWSLLLSAALFTIVDLDATRWGSIQLNTAPMRSALQAIDSSGQQLE